MFNNISDTRMPRRTLLGSAAVAAAAMLAPPSIISQETPMHPFAELLQTSQAEKKGLVFYLGGQTVAGIVTKITGGDLVEVRNQTHSRILIRLDRVDAVAMS